METIVFRGAAMTGRLASTRRTSWPMAARQRREACVRLHQQSAGPLAGLGKWNIKIGFINLPQIHAVHVAGDTDHHAACDEGVILAGKGTCCPFPKPIFRSLPMGVFIWPKNGER